ncbi:hypothetical protein [Escherichia coli]|uniref:hypothetical protein n=1 Tax=Escherichia coli TaxID=562 RepID=UPI001D68B6AB|nr:hypothetical protein [Escherichia coli]CAH5721940.1 hypothetical protein AI2994V1_3264 [Escherichia coli]
MSHPPKKLKKSLITVFLSGILAVLGYFVALNGVFDLYQHIADNFLQKKAGDAANLLI